MAIGVVAVVASAAALIPGAGSSRQIGPKLTHTITRGDLIVTVAEQGTLESSENTEITCKVRGQSTVIWVIEGGTEVKPGDELVRLDTLALEDFISERSKYAHWSRSSAERSKANVERAKLAIPEYLEGRYHSELMRLQKDLAIAESNLRTAQNMLDHAKMMAERGYVSELEVEEKTFAVTQAKLDLEVTNTEIDVLKRFTKEMELKTLEGDLNAAEASLAAAEERAKMDETRRDLAKEELGYCVIKAERSGLVIYPSAAPWKNAPEIEEGATVHKDQVLLLMPDLSRMQVKVGIRESTIDRVKPGLVARVTLPDKTLEGEVSSVASVTAPAGWWTGNVVKYDTIIELPSVEGLKPGMSAEVEVIVARHEDVLTIPVAAVVETADGDFCWVKTADGPKRRSLGLGDTNDVFTVVEAGLKEGDEVVLNTLAFIEHAQTDALKPFDETKPDKRDSTESAGKRRPQDPASDKPAGDSELEEVVKPQADSKPQVTRDQIMKLSDKKVKPEKP
jgi:multidrug efflux pump subunit AcrA (membrane-fusion protein)